MSLEFFRNVLPYTDDDKYFGMVWPLLKTYHPTHRQVWSEHIDKILWLLYKGILQYKPSHPNKKKRARQVKIIGRRSGEVTLKQIRQVCFKGLLRAPTEKLKYNLEQIRTGNNRKIFRSYERLLEILLGLGVMTAIYRGKVCFVFAKSQKSFGFEYVQVTADYKSLSIPCRDIPKLDADALTFRAVDPTISTESESNTPEDLSWSNYITLSEDEYLNEISPSTDAMTWNSVNDTHVGENTPLLSKIS
jgi:hypothetical protein